MPEVKEYFGITAPDNQQERRSLCSLRMWDQNWLDNQLETFWSSYSKILFAICISASGVKIKGKMGRCKELLPLQSMPSQSIPCLFATSTRWLTRHSSLASLFDLLERRHILSASGLFADHCLTTTLPSSFTPSQNILQSSQKWRDILEHLDPTSTDQNSRSRSIWQSTPEACCI